VPVFWKKENEDKKDKAKTLPNGFAQREKGLDRIYG
jgi:hypothetical protein